MASTLIRTRYPFNKADLRQIKEIEREDSEIVSTRIGPEGERQVRTADGEIYNLDSRQYHAKRLARFGGHNPKPPAPAAAIRVAA